MLLGLVGQDPLEMIWIEKQATILLFITLGILFLWFFKEFFRIYLSERSEKRFREGMISLFLKEKKYENKTK